MALELLSLGPVAVQLNESYSCLIFCNVHVTYVHSTRSEWKAVAPRHIGRLRAVRSRGGARYLLIYYRNRHERVTLGGFLKLTIGLKGTKW